jgi:hypothetical protein
MPRPRPRVRRPSAPMIIAVLALFVALGGPAQAGRLISGGEIKKGSITSKQIKDRSLTRRDLAKPAVKALTATPNNAVTASKLAENAVTTRALAPGSVLSGSVGDNSLTADDLASNSVGGEEVADNAIGQAEIRPNGVGSSEIADNSIEAGKVIDGGLGVRDVARLFGTFEFTVGKLDPGICQLPVDVSITGTAALAGAFILASPVSAWPSSLVYTVDGTSTANAFKIHVCNRGAVTVAGAQYTFNFAVLAP